MYRRIALILTIFSGMLAIAQPAAAQLTYQGATQVHTGLSVQHGIAYAARHDVYLMVYDDRLTGGVKGRFVNAAGAAVGNEFVIAALQGAAYANDPMVAYSNDSPDDVFFVMYATDRGKQFDGPPSAYIQRVSFTGTGGAVVGTPILASGGSYEVPNDIVFNPVTRKFVAAWERLYGANTYKDVELRFFNVDGTPSGGTVNVSNGDWTQAAARLAVDWETNRIMVAYEGVSPASPSAQVEILGLWAKIVDGSTGALLTGMLTVQSGFTLHAVPVFLPERDGFMVAWTAFGSTRDVQARFVSSATGSIGTIPAGVYTLAGTPSRSEDEPMGIYDATSRKVLMAFQSSGACPNDACSQFDGAVLDAMGAVQVGPFTGLSTPTATAGTYSPDVAVGEGGQFGLSMAVGYAANYVERVSWPAAGTPGPIFGGGAPSPNVVASPSSLSFTVNKNGAVISGFSPQNVAVSFATAPVAWTATTSTPWLQVTSGSGSGNGQFTVTIINPGDVIGAQTSLNGTVTLTAPGAPNSPVTVPISLTVAPSGGAITILSATQVHTGLSVQHGIAYAARHDVYLMVYDDRLTGGVKGRFVNAAGAAVGNEFVIAALQGAAYANDPMVAYSNDTADDVFFVMYATDRGKAFDGPPSAWIQRVSFTGTGGAVVGTPILASGGSYEIPNDIVFNPVTRKFVAAWERLYGANTYKDVELRFFNVDGTPSGGTVNVSNGDWTQAAARLAVDWETNRIMVAYEGVSPASPSAQVEILGLWAKIVDGSTGALLTGMLTVQSGFTLHAIPVFLPERDGFMVAWTAFGSTRDVHARFVSSATGTVGTMPAPVYTLAGTARSEDEPMGIYDAISRRVLMAFQSSGGCPNDACAYFDGAVLDAMGVVQLGPFTGLSTAVSPTGAIGTYSPDMAVGEGGQFGISLAAGYNSNWVQRISLSPSDTPGPIFGGGTANGVALPTNLSFTIVKSGATIGGFLPQVVPVTFTGTPFAWTAASTVPWLQVTGGSGTGNGQFSVTVINPADVIGSQTSLAGSIVVTAPGAVNSPATLPVGLTVAAGPAPADPFGQVDSPAQSATGVQGAIAITGWALDDTLVSSVTVYRNCLAFEPQGNCQLVLGNNVVLVGQAVFLQGARPDVEAAFPFYPNANRAGWGVQVLTNMLPHVPSQLMLGGQGALTLYAVATDNSGNKKLLGRSFVPSDASFNTPTSVTLANDTIAKPFGMLDTPAQGQTIGGVYAVFGWALTPDIDTVAGAGDILIPTNGSTVNVYVDGLLKGPVTFNQCRGSVGNPVPAGLYCNDDIANLFGNTTPQPLNTTRTSNPTKYRNLDVQRGAIGSYVLNTNTLTNGLHTISWSVVDSAGRSEGVGSRFFTVSNGAPLADSVTFAPADNSARMLATELDSTPVGTEAVWGRTGFDPRQAWQAMPLDDAGERRVLLPEMGRLDLWLGAPVDRAYLSANGTLRPLPPGSSLQGANFTWAPGPGLVGNYALVFLRGDERIDVLVTIESRTPKEGESEVRMHLDAPSTGGWTGRGVTITGWAVDPGSAIGAGVDAVHVWARRLGDDAPSSPVFLGEATLGVQRPDAARSEGARFSHAGFEFTATLAHGRYELTAYVWNQRTARWEASRATVVTVR